MRLTSLLVIMLFVAPVLPGTAQGSSELVVSWQLSASEVRQDQVLNISLVVKDTSGVLENATVSLSVSAGTLASSGTSGTTLYSDAGGKVTDTWQMGQSMDQNSMEVEVRAEVVADGHTPLNSSTSFLVRRYPTLIEFSFLSGEKELELGLQTVIGVQTLVDGEAVQGVHVNITAEVGVFEGGGKTVEGETDIEGVFEVTWDSAGISMDEERLKLSFHAWVDDDDFEPLVQNVSHTLVLLNPSPPQSHGAAEDTDSAFHIRDDVGNFQVIFPLSVLGSIAAGVVLALLVSKRVRR